MIRAAAAYRFCQETCDLLYPEASEEFVLMLATKMQSAVESDELRVRVEQKETVVHLLRGSKS